MEPLWCLGLAAGLAGCLGWGIRGVFGHQAGAIVPGVMIAAAIGVATRRSGWESDHFMRLMAVCAAGLSIGGVETYAQTLGLMHDSFRPRTYWWGLLGAFVKGALWFGLAGALMALAQGGHLVAAWQIVVLAVLAVAAGEVGRRLLNEPFAPPERYPFLYFSHRHTDEEDLKTNPPRREYWGALLFGFVAILAYGGGVLHARGMGWMALVGFVGGGVGFAFGEVLQAWGRWHAPFGRRVQSWMDWWKVMEMTFGLVAGVALGVGFGYLYEHGGSMADVADGGSWWPACLVPIWLALMVLAANGWRPAQRLRGVPLLAGMLLLVALSGGPSLGPRVVIWVFLPYITGVMNLLRWRPQMTPRAYWCWHALLVVATWALAVAGGALGWTRDPAAILLVTALWQSALCFSHALAEREKGSFRRRFSELKDHLAVIVGFVILCGALWALVGAGT